jgi:hypothetical protein
MTFFAIFFAGALGVSDAAMKPEVIAGPFPTLRTCYAASALGVDGLNRKYPKRDFRAICSTRKAWPLRHPHLHDLQTLAHLASEQEPMIDVCDDYPSLVQCD